LRRWVIVGTLGALGLACELLLPTHALDDTGDAGADTGPVSTDTCVHALPPAPPAVHDAGGTTQVVAAVRTFTLTDAGSDLGFDLDHNCTCDSGVTSCGPPGGTEYCDLPGGRDIEGNKVIGTALDTALASNGFGTIDSRIGMGLAGYLVELKDYNGEANDDQVYLDMFDSSGLGAPSTTNVGDFDFHPPAWDGNDAWSVDCGLSVATCPPRARALWVGDAGITSAYFDSQAYVTDNMLVARPKIIRLAVASTSLAVTDTLIVAKLTPALGSFRLDGQVAGRVTTKAIFEMLATVHLGEADAGKYLCPGQPDLEQFRQSLCNSADIAASSAFDNQGKPCEALSISVPFTAFPAKIGYQYDRPSAPSGCPNGIADCSK
jgi:hypothetical protein